MRIGRVKWFNKKGGFGFLTDVSEGMDYFVHHKDLEVKKECYRYLMEGEYVEYEKGSPNDASKHEYQARKIRGINDKGLLCEVSASSGKTAVSAIPKEVSGPESPTETVDPVAPTVDGATVDGATVTAPPPNENKKPRRQPKKRSSTTGESKKTAAK